MAHLQELIRLPLLIKRFHVTDFCAIALIIVGVTAIVGWAFEVRPLASLAWSTSYPVLKVNTALGLVMLGIGLFALRRQLYQQLGFASLTTLLIAFCTLYELFTETNLRIDTLFFDDCWSNQIPGRMSTASALALTLAALLLIGHRALSYRHHKIYNLLQLLYLAVPLISVNAYLLDTELQPDLAYAPSIPATIGFLLFFVGLSGTTSTGISILLQGQNTSCCDYRKTVIIIGVSALLVGVSANYAITHSLLRSSIAIALVGSTMFIILLFLISLSYEKQHNREINQQKKLSAAQTTPSAIDLAMLDILAQAKDGLLLINEQRKIVRANRGACDILEWPEQELLGKPAEQLLPERFRVHDISLFYDFLASDETSRDFNRKGKTLGLTRRGFEKPLSVTIFKTTKSSLQGPPKSLVQIPGNEPFEYEQPEQPVYILALIQELSALESDVIERQQRAEIDTLTGLPNQNEFSNYCAQFQNHAQRHREENLSIMLIDIDNFDLLIQRYDRDFGDQILRTVAATLKHTLRTSDKLFRLDSKRFVMIATNRERSDAELVAERIRTAIKVAPTKLDNKNIYTTSSIGVIFAQNQKPDIRACVDHLIVSLKSDTSTHDTVKTMDCPATLLAAESSHSKRA